MIRNVVHDFSICQINDITAVYEAIVAADNTY
jgi:hypothetical protein